MAAATTLIVGGVALAGAAAQTASGIAQTAKANKAINNYQRQDLTNKMEDIQISTMGSDLMREESARTTNTMINTIARGGSRAINANIGKITAANSQQNKYAAYDIEQQSTRRNELIARENARIQDMYENRENQDLYGLGAQLQAGRDTTWNGLSSMQTAIGFMGNNGVFDKKPKT
jgi:hypothetical protein